MALSVEDRQEIKDLITTSITGTISDIKGNITGINARIESQYNILNLKMDGVHSRLDHLNGTVATHEKTIQERALVVNDFVNFKDAYKDIPKRVRDLEDDNLSAKSAKKLMAWMFTGGIALGGLVVGIVKLIIG